MTMRPSVFAMKYRIIIRARARRFPRATWSAWNPSNRFSKEFTIGAIPIIRRSMPSAFANFFASFRSFPPFPSGIATARTRCGPSASAHNLATRAESTPPLSPSTTPFRPLSRNEWTRKAWIRNIRFEMLDSRNIVYHGKLYDGAVSNLGIPALGYDRVFQEVHRVLKPSGRFVFSEWPTDPNPSFAALRELLEKHGTRSPSKDLAQVREAVRLVRTDPEAKALGDPRSVLKALGVAGFEKRDATTKTFPVRFTSVAELVVFAGSYGWYERELREMTTESRKTFDEELAIRLKPLTTSSGIEDTWTLNLFVARSE